MCYIFSFFCIRISLPFLVAVVKDISMPRCTHTFDRFQENPVVTLVFSIFDIKIYNNKITYDTAYEILYDTKNTVPKGAIYQD